jgi:hypothetical protein
VVSQFLRHERVLRLCGDAWMTPGVPACAGTTVVVGATAAMIAHDRAAAAIVGRPSNRQWIGSVAFPLHESFIGGARPRYGAIALQRSDTPAHPGVASSLFVANSVLVTPLGLCV